MFQSRHSQDHIGALKPNSVLWFVILFAASTYVLLSTRAVLNPVEVKNFIDLKRILSVLGGAALLSVIIDAAISAQNREPRAQLLAVLRFTLIGTVSLFLLREAYDLVISGELAQGIGRNVRWMLGFIGYFTTAVATFFAFSYYRQLQVARAHTMNTQAIATTPTKGVEYEEIAALLAVMQAQTGYESADLDIRPEARLLQERRLHIEQLLARLSQAKPA